MSEPQTGWCDPQVQRELPGLRVFFLDAALSGSRATGPSTPAVLGRLRTLSDRWRGARAVNVRQEAVPAAYRVLFRQIGLDPDATRTPIEAAVLGRMLDGGFLSTGMLSDVLTIATVDTGVPVWALDADALAGPLGIRLSRAGERLGGLSSDGPMVEEGHLVVADAERPLALLFGEPAAAHAPCAGTRSLLLFALQVAGVPKLHVEEALWTCRLLLADGDQSSASG